jgi:hypothetical protein
VEKANLATTQGLTLPVAAHLFSLALVGRQAKAICIQTKGSPAYLLLARTGGLLADRVLSFFDYFLRDLLP